MWRATSIALTLFPADTNPTRADLDAAIAAYWDAKATQLAAAQLAASTAEGSSKAVRGGKHFAPIALLMARFFLAAGYPPSSIGTSGSLTVLPGHFRPTKSWDLVVVHRDVLVAAIEMKALGGPSFSNNYNNRTEEALGNALDLSHANLHRLVGREQPWLGYFLLMNDEVGSRRPCRETRGTFPMSSEWRGKSYQGRFGITGTRMVDEKLYDAVCYVVSSPDDPGPREPAARLDWQHFSAAVEGRISYLKGLGYP